MTATVSVLLATFDGARFLSAQLDSVVGQTRPPDEIVVVDDGSADGTLELVEAYRDRSAVPITTHRRSAPLGAADNFLDGLSFCRGNFIAFCDQDDVWAPGKLELCVARLVRDRSLLAIHTATITDESLEPIGPMRQGIRRNRVFGPGELDPYLGAFSGWGNTMVLSAALREVLQAPRPPQPRTNNRPLSHDTWTYVAAAALGSVSHIAEPLLLYRQHGRNLVGVEVEGVQDRVAAAAVSPVDDYRARERFYEGCAQAFDALAERRGSTTFDYAAAARLYAARRDEVRRRIGVYTAGGRGARLGALLRLHLGPRVAFGESRGLRRAASLAKDLRYGVFG